VRAGSGPTELRRKHIIDHPSEWPSPASLQTSLTPFHSQGDQRSIPTSFNKQRHVEIVVFGFRNSCWLHLGLGEPDSTTVDGQKRPAHREPTSKYCFLCSELGVVVEQPDDGPGDMFVYVFLIPAGPPTVIVNNISDTISLDV
jgi:hypothetical protein